VKADRREGSQIRAVRAGRRRRARQNRERRESHRLADSACLRFLSCRRDKGGPNWETARGSSWSLFQILRQGWSPNRLEDYGNGYDLWTVFLDGFLSDFEAQERGRQRRPQDDPLRAVRRQALRARPRGAAILSNRVGREGASLQEDARAPLGLSWDGRVALPVALMAGADARAGTASALSIGHRGAWYTIGPHGRRVTLGLPGTGLFWTERIPPHRPAFFTPIGNDLRQSAATKGSRRPTLSCRH
jgi:hypothetical protein